MTIYALSSGPGVSGIAVIRISGTENGNFPLLYVVKMSLCRGVGGSKKPQNTLT